MIALLLLLLGCTQEPYPTRRPADACAAGALPTGERTLRLEIGEQERVVRVWHPEGAGPHDLIVALHDHGEDGRSVARSTGWIEEAASSNAILVAPSGIEGSWNAGACCGRPRARNVGDADMLDALVEQIARTSCTSGRVLATGEGAGAMMAHRWACESDTPTGLITAGGGLQVAECPRKQPIPVLTYTLKSGEWPSVKGASGLLPMSATVTEWERRNATRMRYELDEGDLQCSIGKGSAPVATCTVAGEPGWPGAVGHRLESRHALSDATRGGWAFVRDAWDGQLR